MSILFDALRHAQDNEGGAPPGDDSQVLDLSEPEVAMGMEKADLPVVPPPNPAATAAAAPPVGTTPITEKTAPGAAVLAAKAIFLATTPPPRRIAVFVAAGLAILLLAGGGGFWYCQREVASLAATPAILSPPPAPATDLAGPLSRPAETPAPASEELSPVSATKPAAQAPAPVTGAPSETKGAATSADDGADLHGEPAPAESMAPAPSPPAAKTGELMPMIARPGRNTVPPPRKLQAKRQSPQPAPRSKPSATDVSPSSLPASEEVAASHIRLRVGTDPLREAYQALSSGRLEEAERLYQEVIGHHPQERDALLGLAVIAHRRLQTEHATDLYRQVLREDPGNATATAALVNLSMQVDPVAAESRLKQLLDKQPSSPELNHALGRVLARQKRWGEAQQAFFRAVTLAPDSALYAYNLAVALDRLHKPAAALPYYEKASQILKPGDAALDRDTIQRRVQELRCTLPE